jgi:hypothetical protein
VNDTAVQNPKKNPWPLIAILAITLVPLVAAYVAYFTGMGVPDDTVNEGELLSPAKNIAVVLADAEGDIPELSNNLKWRLFIPVPQQCGDACQQNLYVTRQVHIRLAEKGERVERFAVNIGGTQGAEFLQQIKAEQPGLRQFTVTDEAWQAWLHDTNAPVDLAEGHYYLLVDQVGFAMMYYTTHHDGNQLLKDLKRVLRYSPGG